MPSAEPGSYNRPSGSVKQSVLAMQINNARKQSDTQAIQTDRKHRSIDGAKEQNNMFSGYQQEYQVDVERRSRDQRQNKKQRHNQDTKRDKRK